MSNQQAEEADSDSDWDSLSGGLASDPEPSPRPLQPAPPSVKSKSPRPHTQNKQHGSRGSPSTSKPSSPVISEARKTPAVTNKARQLYGKSGITNFVDRSQAATTFADTGTERKRNADSPSVGKKKSRGRTEGINNNGLEMNELDFNPPYTDFKDALPQHEVPPSTKPEQKRGKVKSSYIRSQTPDNQTTELTQHGNHVGTERWRSNNSWDMSEHEDTLQLTEPQQPDKQLVAGDSHDTQICCVPTAQGLGNQYVFSHGRNHYLSVAPEWRDPYMKTMEQRSEKWLKYFWQEVFGALGLVVDFVLIFLLELIRFLLRKVLLRVLSGMIVVFSDNLLKPYLASAFNSFIQPLFVFTWNVLAGLRNVLSPLLDISREVVLQVATLVKSFRLFELNWKPVINKEVQNTQKDSIVIPQHRVQDI